MSRNRVIAGLLRHGPPLLGVVALAVTQGIAQGPTGGVVMASVGLLAWLLVWPLSRQLRRRRIVVRAGGHSAHRGAVPTMGGLVVVVPFALVLATTAVFGAPKELGLLLGLLLLLGAGALDDLRGLSPRVKILAQVAAGIILLGFGYRLDVLDATGLTPFVLGPLGPLMLVGWVVLATNAYNIIDGMDGIAAGVGIVTALGLVAVGTHPLLAATLAAALLGFLAHNLPRARIFLGDAGTMPIGFVFAALLLELPAKGNLPLAVGLFAYPLLDVGLALTRRFVRGKPLFRGDRSHIHHKLAGHLRSDRRAVLTVWVLAAAAAVLVIRRPTFNAMVLLGLMGVLIAFILVFLHQVQLKRMLGSRLPFQELHLTRQYVEGRLRLARDAADVERALERLVEDLHLARLEVGPLVLTGHGHGDPNAVTKRVRLDRGWAHWAYVPNGHVEEPALVLERQIVVSGILMIAARHLSKPPPEESP